jgi:glycosyltransferase involved in cell wall biosynthesis
MGFGTFERDSVSVINNSQVAVVVFIPCYNEEVTIAKVVTDFKRELPEAGIIVLDNNSTDNTAQVAEQAGAAILKVPTQGKGAVVRHAFREIESDIYVMVDGDDTYSAKNVHDLIAPILANKCDMVIGDRGIFQGDYLQENKRAFHNFGNKLICKIVNFCFKNVNIQAQMPLSGVLSRQNEVRYMGFKWLLSSNVNDVMTGYRAFTRRFVKNIPILSDGFEVETEMTIRCLDRKLNVVTVPISYQDRPKDSFSKLSTFKDGFRILKIIFKILKDYRPLLFFGFLSLLSLIFGLLAGLPVIFEFINNGYILRIPLAILATGLIIVSVIFMNCALILDTMVSHEKQRNELYLAQFTKDSYK